MDVVVWKCDKCGRRYKTTIERDGNVVCATIYPRHRPKYNDCCINGYTTYINTRWRGRVVRGVFFTFDPVNNNYHNLDKLWP